MATGSTINIGSGGGTIVFSATSDPANPTLTISGGGTFSTINGNRVNVSALGGGSTEYVDIDTPRHGENTFRNATSSIQDISMSCSFNVEGESGGTSSSRTAALSVTATTTATTGYSGTATVTSGYTISQSDGGSGNFKATIGIYTSGGAMPGQTITCYDTGQETIRCKKGGTLKIIVGIGCTSNNFSYGQSYRIQLDGGMAAGKSATASVVAGNQVGVTIEYEIPNVGTGINVDLNTLNITIYNA